MSITKRTFFQGIVVIGLAVLGMYVSYWQGWGTGYAAGHTRGYNLAIEDAKSMVPVVEHKYHFIKNGSSLWRVDDATGEACDYFNGVCP